ncbi:MAG: iron-sulfur cluster assembly scaffold protein [Deltaproteobacteria bacterium]|nr:iron-sulfur cluster assembly scaffold protein [Deltaproteobacteria bacterium]
MRKKNSRDKLELKGKMLKEEEDFFSPSAYERWRNPIYRGSIEHPDGHARLTGKCGETIEISLKFNRGHVAQAAFQTDGCAAITVCGSFAAEMAIGKSPEEVLEITGDSLMEIVGSFPEEEAHCAFLAAETLQEALNDYMVRQTALTKPKQEENNVK